MGENFKHELLVSRIFVKTVVIYAVSPVRKPVKLLDNNNQFYQLDEK